jgi:hypothetical protein
VWLKVETICYFWGGEPIFNNANAGCQNRKASASDHVELLPKSWTTHLLNSFTWTRKNVHLDLSHYFQVIIAEHRPDSNRIHFEKVKEKLKV